MRGKNQQQEGLGTQGEERVARGQEEAGTWRRRTRNWLWVQEAVQGGNEAGPCWWPPEKQATKYAEAISSLKEDKQLIHKQILQSRPTI